VSLDLCVVLKIFDQILLSLVSAYRVLQKNLVYVIGLSQRMADAELLKKVNL
jgi:hypothetical protein